ncbi:protogenin-like isoform X2 [Phymastichus coffea]|uniref:protogenin-like isoform X2 n=1 Tax=Phymastichus coffea TaxID=108790 RepID=UPI00273AB0A8|nr:protogenin-like isoform X2 [Phymastichus coffea]
MAATVLLLLSRVLLFGILFTEVLSAGASADTGSGARRSARPAPAAGVPRLEVRPRGEMLLGRRRVATLSCSPSGLARVQRVSWLRDGRVAPPCGPRQRCSLRLDGALRLARPRPGAGGAAEYRCVAHTADGAALRSGPTLVRTAELAEHFEEAPRELAVHEGEVARLACRIASAPAAEVTWFRDGRALAAPAPGLALLPAAGLLFIRAARPSDTGAYRCVAANRPANASRSSAEARLRVLPRRTAPGVLFPQAAARYEALNASELLLACAASGYPQPNASWTFVAAAPASRPVALRSAPGLSLLRLRSLRPEAAGTYVCSASGLAADAARSQNVTVEVLVPPSFVKRPASQVCPNGRTARFECQAQGRPTPRIYWLKDATDIAIDGRRTLYVRDFGKLELAISATVPSDSGIYQCVAVNAAGEAWAAGRLQVNASRDSPAAPTLLECRALSPAKVFVSWRLPEVLPLSNVTAYTIHYRPVDGGKEEVSPPEPGNSTSVQVTKHLQPFTNYTFYVRLWTNRGPSDQSASVTCSTKASVPKAAPKIYANTVSSSKLNITWEPLTRKEAQGVVTQYKLEWRFLHQPSARVRLFPASVQRYLLTDLIPGQQYELRVLARTELGWPNLGDSQLDWLMVTMPSSTDLIEAQISLINSTTIKINWHVSNLIFQLESWNVKLKNDDTFVVIAAAHLTKDANEYEFTNLEPKARYIIELCALNTYAENVNCIRKIADLQKVTMSNAPTALEAIPLSANSISLSWVSKSINGSFEICYNSVHLLNESIICILVNNTQIDIKNLKPFTLYQFKVKALNNSVDNDDDSASIECYTNEDVPGKVEDVEWFFINSTLVRLAWKEPKTVNGIIQRYYVAYSMDDNTYEPKSAWNNVTVFGNKTSISLPTLVPGKRYFVVIQAATKAGTGNPSEPIIIVTAGGNSLDVAGSLDETKSLPKIREYRKFGIILGIGISIISILVCLCSMYCRRRYENMRSVRESAQPLKSRVLTTRNGISQPATAIMSSEIELAVLFPSTPISTNPLCDTKGSDHANGILESKEPLLSPWEMNGIIKDVRITENPQQHEHSRDLNSTQLTTIGNDFAGSFESNLNNNLGNCESAGEVLAAKTVPTFVPMLGPNG